MKKIWNKFQSLAVAKKLLALSLVMSIVPICCILVLNYQLSGSVVRTQTGELIQANLEQNASNIENFYKGYEKIIQGIYTDEFYTQRLKPINRWDNSERYQAEHEIGERLQELCYNNSGVLGIAIFGTHYDTCFYDTVTQSGQSSFCFDLNKIKNNNTMELIKDERRTIYLPSVCIAQEGYGIYNCMYVVHQLTDFSEYQKGSVGFVILCFDETMLEYIYSSGNTKSNVTLIADNKGNVISSAENNWKPQKLELDREKKAVFTQEEIEKAALKYVKTRKILQKTALRAKSKGILKNQIYVLNIQDVNYGMRNFAYISVIIVLVGALAAVLCILLAWYTSNDVDRSMRYILDVMDRATKGGEEQMEESCITGTEFMRISRHFNRMTKRIEESERMERIAMLKEKNAEIQALEAQINPHFLYNTLDAINWMAVDKNEYAISKMLTELAAIMRYSIHGSNEIVELKDELTYLKKYIHLQQERLNYSFLSTLKADESLYHVKIHKMLMQPLVENTLVHGFPGKSEVDELYIEISQSDEQKLRIIVADNGRGMKPELVDLLNHYDYATDKVETSIGVRNVIARLNLYYGNASSFRVESDETGTKITMEIPCGEMEEMR